MREFQMWTVISVVERLINGKWLWRLIRIPRTTIPIPRTTQAGVGGKILREGVAATEAEAQKAAAQALWEGSPDEVKQD